MRREASNGAWLQRAAYWRLARTRDGRQWDDADA